jgi:hypothetical protein
MQDRRQIEEDMSLYMYRFDVVNTNMVQGSCVELAPERGIHSE